MDRSAGSRLLVESGATSHLTGPSSGVQSGQLQLLAALFVGVLAFAAMLYSSRIVLGDPDTLWHIKAGSDIWRNFSVPVEDVYSFTFQGQRWIAKEWLGQLLLFASYEVGGWNGVVFLTAAFVGITAFLFCREVGRASNPRIAVSVTVIAMILASPIFIARPQIFILPLAVMWTASLFRAAEEQRAPSLLLLALLVTWANLHASFLLGIVIAGFAYLHFLETNRFRDKRLFLRWTGFMAACLLAILIHPYGIEPLILAVKLSLGNEWVPMITEWQPFNAKDKPIHELGLLLSLAVLLWTRPRLSLSKIAFLLFALHMFLAHLRFVFVCMLLAPLAVVRDVIPQGSRLSLSAWAAEARDGVERFAVSRFHVSAAVLALALVLSPFILLRSSTQPPAEVSAAKAIQFAQDSQLRGNVLNDYDFGGSLVFHGIPTFVDGRTDQLFLGEFAKTLAETSKPEGSDIFIRQLDHYRIGWTLLRKNDPRNLVLRGLSQWRRIYADDQVMIYERLAGAASDGPGASPKATAEVE